MHHFDLSVHLPACTLPHAHDLLGHVRVDRIDLCWNAVGREVDWDRFAGVRIEIGAILFPSVESNGEEALKKSESTTCCAEPTLPD